jgi:pimeloyl-ACP methyl ester carboxylesterase
VRVAVPETLYGRTVDGLSIAYQALGDGPPDVVLIRAWHTNVEYDWDERVLAHVFRRIASFGRLIVFDRRGMGLSDPAYDGSASSLDAWMDDLTAVLDAIGSESASLVGITNAGTPLCALYAASRPDRVDRLVLYNPHVRELRSDDYPWGDTQEDLDTAEEEIMRGWGRVEAAVKLLHVIAPSRADDITLAEWLATSQRRSASPRAARALMKQSAGIDVRDVLPAIHCPTLVIHRGGPDTPFEEAEWVAARIPASRLVSIPSSDHMFISGDTDAVVDEIERFLTGLVRSAPVLDRTLASLVFTDIVSSTQQLAKVGDRGWAELVERHNHEVRRMIATYRGTEMDTAGDGFFAAFDGPGRAVRCAQEIVTAVRRFGLRVRVGVHTGECEIADGKFSGLAVVVAARVMAKAEPETILVTNTVKDLTAGSGLHYDDVGRHALKGVPDEWQLYRVRE